MNAIISIKPRFVDAIKAGRKHYEFRRRPIALRDAFPGAPIPQSYIYVRTADSEKFTQELLAKTEV